MILDRVKILLGITDTAQDDLLKTLIGMSMDEAILYCNLDVYTSKLDSAVIQMTIEKYNRIGTEGCTSVSNSGINEQYESGYSPQVLSILRKNRKVKCV